MPGPGAHTMYAMGVGAGLMRLSRGRFGPHHCVVYAANAFLGPDLGSFAEWLASCISFSSGLGHSLGSLAMDLVHHPFYYPMLLGLPLSYFYAWLSALLLRKGILDPASGVSLSKMQCFLLLSAGSLSHFFLDHLFEENGHSTMYTWILSTGWWKNSAPINPDAVVVVGLLCTSLFVGFVYINSNFQTEKWKIHHQEIRSILETCPDHRDLVLHLVCQSNILAKPSPTSGRGRSRSRGSCFPGSLLLSPTCLVFTVNEPERLHRHSRSTATLVAASAQHSQPGRSHEDFESIKTRTIQDISCSAATV